MSVTKSDDDFGVAVEAMQAFCTDQVEKLTTAVHELACKGAAVQAEATFNVVFTIDCLKQAADDVLKSPRTAAEDSDLLDSMYYWTLYSA